jgi:uncharacterized protein YozE (UPF0346 family)
LFHDCIWPKQHREFTEFCCFLEKANITRRDVVKSATDHDLCWRLDQGRFLSVVRTLT